MLSAVLLALALVSCGEDEVDAGADTSTPSRAAAEPGTAADSSALPDDESSLSLEDAAAAALKKVRRSSLLTIETELNRTVWEVTVVKRNGTEHEMVISKSDGAFLDGPTRQIDDAEDKAENRALVRAADLDYREAVRAITEAVPDARLLELNLDLFSDRLPAWEGDLHGEDGLRYSVTIDARSGDVLEKDVDAEDDD